MSLVNSFSATENPHPVGTKLPFKQIDLSQLHGHMERDKVGLLPHTINTIKSKWTTVKCKRHSYKILRRKNL
jgi:hypothetical protein